jgi:hypothetical protein
MPPTVISAGRTRHSLSAEQVVLRNGQSGAAPSSVPRDAVVVDIFSCVAKPGCDVAIYLRKGWLRPLALVVMKGAVRDLVYSYAAADNNALGTPLTPRSTFNTCLFPCLNSNGRALTLHSLRC